MFGCSLGSTFEVNAANTRGLDSVREIGSGAHLSTLGGTAKAYIIDESHQLTPAAQEAFLKVIEDYPPQTYFIFCTTEPKGIIATIRNRCTAYEMSILSTDKILELVADVCKKEELEVPDEIQQAIAGTSDGSPRSAIVALEAVKDIDDLDTAITLLLRSTEHDPQVIELCQLMYGAPQVRRQKWRQILQVFDGLSDTPETIRKSILTYLYKKLVIAGDELEALDLAWLINIFSVSVFYGNKAQLGSQVARACFAENPYLGVRV
jgi:DNA polymerase III gamma/tau subunit